MIWCRSLVVELNAILAFHPFMVDESVQIHRVEASGHGIEVEEDHCATLIKGTPGVLQGLMTYVIQ